MISKIILTLMLAVLTLTLSFSIVASASTTTLTTTVPSSYPLAIKIQGKGTVVVNATNFTESCEIEITRNSAVSVHILPDNDYEIESVSYNAENITDKAKNGIFFLDAMEKASQLSITFVRNAAAPETGDSDYYSVQIFSAGMVLSAVCIIAMLVLYKRQSSES